MALVVDGGGLVNKGGALGTGAACCCNKCSGPCDGENPCPEGCVCVDGACVGCCTVGDTQYAPNATVSVTENITGCDEGAVFINAPDLPMIGCGVFEGPGTINESEIVYKVIYNGDGTWQALIDDISDAFFAAVPIPGAGGNTTVAFPCAGDLEGPLDRSSDITITVTGVCEEEAP